MDESNVRRMGYPRYGVISPLLSAADVRPMSERFAEQAEKVWTLPGGRLRQSTAATISDGYYDYRKNGFEALVSPPRRDRGTHRVVDERICQAIIDDQRQRHMASLTRFVHRRGFAAVAGRPGFGKTALVRYFTQSLHQPSYKFVYLPFTNLSENDVLKALCSRLDCEPPHSRNRVVNAIQTRIRELQPPRGAEYRNTGQSTWPK